MRYIATQGGPADDAGHFAPITSVEWSPTGEHIATGSYDGSAIIWEGDSLQVAKRFRHTRLVNGVRWSRDGSFLAVACADGHCHVWTVATGDYAAVLSRHTDDVNSVAWAADGLHIATVSEDSTGRIWAITDQVLLEAILVHADHCMSADWHPVHSQIATCGEDASVKLWDRLGLPIADWPQPGALEMVRWSPKGDRLACACDDRTVRILTPDGKELLTLGPHDGAVKSVAWSPDGSMIATGAYDLSVSVWRLDNAQRMWRYSDARLWPRSISWSPNGHEIAAGSQNGVPFILDALDPPRVIGLGARKLKSADRPTYGINSIAATGDRWICGLDDGTLRLWSPQEGSSRRITSEALARSSSLINAVAYHDHLAVVALGRFSGGVVLVSVEGVVHDSAGVGAPVNAVAWSPSGNLLAVADYDGRVTIFACNALTLRLDEVCSIPAHAAAIKGLAWLNADHIVTGATDRTLRIVKTNGDVLLSMHGHGNLINAVAVTSGADRQLIASASRDRTVRIWDPESGKCEHVLIGHMESVKSVAWKPGSSSELVTGAYDFDARVWNLALDLDKKGYCRDLLFHRQGVGAVAWTANRIATASWDAAIALWKPDQQEAITLVASHAFQE